MEKEKLLISQDIGKINMITETVNKTQPVLQNFLSELKKLDLPIHKDWLQKALSNPVTYWKDVIRERIPKKEPEMIGGFKKVQRDPLEEIEAPDFAPLKNAAAKLQEQLQKDRQQFGVTSLPFYDISNNHETSINQEAFNSELDKHRHYISDEKEIADWNIFAKAANAINEAFDFYESTYGPPHMAPGFLDTLFVNTTIDGKTRLKPSVEHFNFRVHQISGASAAPAAPPQAPPVNRPPGMPARSVAARMQ